MPRYTYKCNDCGNVEEIQHAMSAENIELSCGHSTFEKLPPGSLNFARDIKPKEKEVGDLVKSTIEDTKEYLRSEKAEAGKRIWKPS